MPKNTTPSQSVQDITPINGIKHNHAYFTLVQIAAFIILNYAIQNKEEMFIWAAIALFMCQEERSHITDFLMVVKQKILREDEKMSKDA